MKKIIFGSIAIAAFVISLFAGRKLRFHQYIEDTLEKMQTHPAAQLLTALPGKKAEKVVEAAADKVAEKSDHSNSQERILQVREVMKIKKFEKVVLKSHQREAFKKTFMAIALSPSSTWLMQRQALRNLYVHKIELSDQENKLLLATVDQRAMNSIKRSDVEMLKDAVTAL